MENRQILSLNNVMNLPSQAAQTGQRERAGLPPNTSSGEPPCTRSANQEKATEDNRRPSLDISTMRLAIESGDPKAVDNLMERLSDTLAVDKLTTTYGGDRDVSWRTDEDGLIEKTSPILHAARSGNSAVFKSVMNAMQKRLSQGQVKGVLTSMDERGNSLLARAVESKCTDTFEAVLHVVTRDLTTDEVNEMILCVNKDGDRLPNEAVRSGSVEMFKAVMATIFDKFTQEEVKDMILRTTNNRVNEAVRSCRVGMFRRDTDTEEEVEAKNLCRNNCRDGLLKQAVKSGRVEMFKTVMTTIYDILTEEEVKRIISSRNYHVSPSLSRWFESLNIGGSSLLSRAVESRSMEMFKAVMVVVVDNLHEEEVVELLCNKDGSKQTPLGLAIVHDNLDMCETVLRKVQDYLVHSKMQNALDGAFLSWIKLYEDDDSGCITSESTPFKILLMLLKHSARPPTEFLQWVVRDVVTAAGYNLWSIFADEIVLIGIESARNPLIPGMNLSVPLAEAAEGAREGDRNRLISLQKRVDEYLLEVLKRLPQTIQGFSDKMDQCSTLFEPEGPRNRPRGRPGPLRVAFERRHHTESLCTLPLVMDYLSRRFSSGLPDMRDTGRVLQDETALSRLASEDDVGGLVLGDTEDSILRDILQGADGASELPSLTILPGAQFIITGLLAKPNIYYRVPAIRMAMDFVVYIIMLHFYSFWVLLHEDGPLTTAEIFFAFYVLAGVFNEVAEIRRNLNIYLQDPWNFFDVLALVMLAGGFFVRLADDGSPWGRALYALSAPLVFLRVLFFVQILQFQGPMIQVMFTMGMVLFQFAVILFVVMMGFAMALYPLLRDDNDFTFGAALLLVFQTLLGDVDAFEAFDESEECDESTQNRYSTAGRLLLAVYLMVMTIMLLNLLIAVLSTRLTSMDINGYKEFKASRARMIEHYRLAVVFGILPAPFNILQLVLTLPFLFKGKSAAHAKMMEEAVKMIEEAVGQVSFWLVLSPLAFAGGVLLWVTSSVYNICRASKWLDLLRFDDEPTGPALAFTYIMLCLWCALGVPSCLLAFWLRQPFLVIYNGVMALIGRPRPDERRDSTPSDSASGDKKRDADVQKMLSDAGTGASDLWKYLEDPLCDPKVRPDEVDRGTTVKHMKLLRDRLENKFKERGDHLDDTFSEHVDHLDKKFNERDGNLDKKFSGHVDHLGKEFNERVDHLGKEFNERVDYLDKKFSEHVDHLGKEFYERVDSLETNMKALASETNRNIGLVLETLRRK